MKTTTLIIVILFTILVIQPHAQGQDNIIHACYKKHNGQMRMVNNPNECHRSETYMSWNTKGLDGANGLNCWDLNADNFCTTNEDITRDGICDTSDCQSQESWDEERIKAVEDRITTIENELSSDEYVFCQSCDGISSYSCTRQQAAGECASLGMHLCSVAQLNAYAEEGLEVCCLGWTSDPNLTTPSRTDGIAAFFMGSSTSTGISSGCGGDPGGMREGVRDHLEKFSAHCCK